ncbi:Cysteine-rich repeat secretory protein 60 [Zea mays]|uniref:Cysteine-rich repeat secretory protein 60 n=1 Tax=Zea mays TaxID=4577 RepID=A0A3L6DEW0_MAIZE|nr:Cysteine-rich repeat secretory protein 60 [Zea mays]
MVPVVALMMVLCACTMPARGGDDYTAFVYAGCSQGRYDPGSQYAADVDTALSSLANSAGFTAYANYTSPSPSGLEGVYQCRSDLPAAVCGVCVKSAVSKLASLCSAAAGAAVQLRACFARYGNDSFLGKQDTTAMSQCVGDLGAKACTDCVSAAASQLKAGCGYASAAEVYLGKCYARFWSNAGGGGVPVGGGAGTGGGGVGGGAAGNGYAYGGFVPNTYGQHDESGKTLAIIIGLVAAVAIVIVFLSFLRRAGAVGGKS